MFEACEKRCTCIEKLIMKTSLLGKDTTLHLHGKTSCVIEILILVYIFPLGCFSLFLPVVFSHACKMIGILFKTLRFTYEANCLMFK